MGANFFLACLFIGVLIQMILAMHSNICRKNSEETSLALTKRFLKGDENERSQVLIMQKLLTQAGTPIIIELPDLSKDISIKAKQVRDEVMRSRNF